jgi:hypothetical protein
MSTRSITLFPTKMHIDYPLLQLFFFEQARNIMQEVSIMDCSALTLSPNSSIRIVDQSALTISPNSIMSTALDTAQQKRPRFVQPEDTYRGILEESQETLAGINLSSNHIYNRRRRCLQPQGSCQGQGSLLENVNKQVTSLFESKEVQGTCHHSQLTRNTSFSKKKTVRFGDHHDHCSANSLSIQVRVHTIEPIHSKYRDQVYWTEPQLLQLQRAAKRVAAHYSDHKTPYVAAIHRILQSHRSPFSSTSNDDSGTSNDTNTTSNTAANDVVQVLVESAARGLESRIVPVLKYYRKRTVRAVLKLQYQLRMSGELEHSDAEMAVHLLRRKSLQASQPCRHLARQLALGDAAAAHITGQSSIFEPMMPKPTPTPSVWLQEHRSCRTVN